MLMKTIIEEEAWTVTRDAIFRFWIVAEVKVGDAFDNAKMKSIFLCLCNSYMIIKSSLKGHCPTLIVFMTPLPPSNNHQKHTLTAATKAIFVPVLDNPETKTK